MGAVVDVRAMWDRSDAATSTSHAAYKFVGRRSTTRAPTRHARTCVPRNADKFAWRRNIIHAGASVFVPDRNAIVRAIVAYASLVSARGECVPRIIRMFVNHGAIVCAISNAETSMRLVIRSRSIITPGFVLRLSVVTSPSRVVVRPLLIRLGMLSLLRLSGSPVVVATRSATRVFRAAWVYSF